MKELIWKMLPAFIRKAWSKGTPSPYGWFGNYASWQEAEKEATGYDSEIILGKVRDALRKVKRGEAAFERDSVVFLRPDSDPNVLKCLDKIAAANTSKLNVADFGGSLGSTYFQYKTELRATIEKWTVIEQRHFVEAGKAEFADGVLDFQPTLKEALRVAHPQALLLFSVLPYIEDPFMLIEEILSYDFGYILVDRTPFIASGAHRITLQVVPESIYKASYPAWFFNEAQFLAAFAAKYEVIHRFSSKFAGPYTLSDGTRAEWKGFLLKRR